jgi:hypothetical protein
MSAGGVRADLAPAAGLDVRLQPVGHVGQTAGRPSYPAVAPRAGARAPTAFPAVQPVTPCCSLRA